MTVKRVDLSDTGIGLDGLRYVLEMLDENTVITDIVSTLVSFYDRGTDIIRNFHISSAKQEADFPRKVLMKI